MITQRHNDSLKTCSKTMEPWEDTLILKYLPAYHQQTRIMAGLLAPYQGWESLKVLDLGCGQGSVSYLILQRLPNAFIDLLDENRPVLELCELNLAAYESQIRLIHDDIELFEFEQPYNIVVSSMAFHSLPDAGKRELFFRIYKNLESGGSLLIRDILPGENPSLTRSYLEMLLRQSKSDKPDIEMWLESYNLADSGATLLNQMLWMQEAGFTQVDCYWKYLNFALYGGKKGGQSQEAAL